MALAPAGAGAGLCERSSLGAQGCSSAWGPAWPPPASLQGHGAGRACGRRASRALRLAREPGALGAVPDEGGTLPTCRGFRSIARMRTAARDSRPRGPRRWQSLGLPPSARWPPSPAPGHGGSPRGEMPEDAGRTRKARGRLRRPPRCFPGRGVRAGLLEPGSEWLNPRGARAHAGRLHAAVRPASGPARAERVRTRQPADPVALCP